MRERYRAVSQVGGQRSGMHQVRARCLKSPAPLRLVAPRALSIWTQRRRNGVSVQLKGRIESQHLVRLAQLGRTLRDGVGVRCAEPCPQIDP